jgi:hypothetical protein
VTSVSVNFARGKSQNATAKKIDRQGAVMQRSFRLAALSCAFLIAAGCSSQQMQGLNSVGKDYGMAVLCGVGVN